MSNVLLGVTDQRIQSDSEVDWSVSKIGGSPNFSTPSSSPPLPRCGHCEHVLALVVQVYCPLEASVYHRGLYVFACTNKQCWNQQNSWAVLRSQNPDSQSRHGNQQTEPASSNHSNTTSDDWGTGDADWGDDEEDNKTEAVSMATEWADDADDWGDAENSAESSCGPVAQFQRMNIDEEGKGLSEVSKNEVAMSISQSILCDLLDPSQLKAQKDAGSVSNQAATGMSDSVLSSRVSCKAGIEKQREAAQSVESKQFASYYISVFDEPQFEKEELVHERKLLAEYSQREGGDLCDNFDGVNRKGKRKGGGAAEKSQRHMRGGGGGGGGGESYEKALPKHGDRTFSKFAKQVALCPEQILRYSHGGSPCYIRHPASVSVPPCQYCGAARLYELQLMPALVNFLHGDDPRQEMSVEFGTVLVFTCSQSCWEDSDLCKEEYVIVQPDPDQHLFKT